MKHRLLVISIILSAPGIAIGQGPRMARVPAGTFIMGDGASWCGVDEREVTLARGFHLGVCEVTNQEYLEAVTWAYENGYVTATTAWVRDNLDGSTAVLLYMSNYYCEIQFDSAGRFYLRESPSAYAQVAFPSGYDPSDHPVKEVTWFGAVRYCDWMSMQEGLPRAYEHGGDPYGAEGYRLPTDAEWEYAAQWDDERIYPWGNQAPDCSRANFDHTDYCVGWTCPVGSYPEAPQTLGLSDMEGNLNDWCNDWWQCHLGTAPATDPTGPATGGTRVLRSSCWGDRYPYLRVAVRRSSWPGDDNYVASFRLARTCQPSSVGSGSVGNRARLTLEPCRPNPSAGVTWITYSILASAGRSAVFLAIFDASGRRIRTLVETEQPAGRHVLAWNGTDDTGRRVKAGAYFCRLRAGGQEETGRLFLVR